MVHPSDRTRLLQAVVGAQAHLLAHLAIGEGWRHVGRVQVPAHNAATSLVLRLVFIQVVFLLTLDEHLLQVAYAIIDHALLLVLFVDARPLRRPRHRVRDGVLLDEGGGVRMLHQT